MVKGDRYVDADGTEWIVTLVTTHAFESIGNPPIPAEQGTASSPAPIEEVVDGLITTLVDKGVLY